MAYRNYSDDEKAVTIAYFDACQNYKMTGRECGIPEATVRLWVQNRDMPSAPSAESVTKKRGCLADKLEQLAHSIVDVAPDKIGEAPLAASMTALGIAVDKMRLLREQPTTIAAQVKTVEERDKKVQEIFERGKLRMAG